MMSSIDVRDACNSIKNWSVTAAFSVGGFEWLAFSKESRGKMIVISAQRTTIVDCNTGIAEDCNIVFDEQELLAYCDRLPDEALHLAGQYGGKLPHVSAKGESVVVKTNDAHRMKIVFVSGFFHRKLIYDCYDAYVCGFSYDGDYFVLADDGGILILGRADRDNIL